MNCSWYMSHMFTIWMDFLTDSIAWQTDYHLSKTLTVWEVGRVQRYMWNHWNVSAEKQMLMSAKLNYWITPIQQNKTYVCLSVCLLGQMGKEKALFLFFTWSSGDGVDWLECLLFSDFIIGQFTMKFIYYSKGKINNRRRKKQKEKA